MRASSAVLGDLDAAAAFGVVAMPTLYPYCPHSAAVEEGGKDEGGGGLCNKKCGVWDGTGDPL